MSRKLTIAIAVLLVLAAFGIYGWKEYHRRNTDLAEVTASFNVHANDLIREFEANDSAATKKYIGKVVAVEGQLKKIDKDEEGFYTMVLGDSSSMSSVRCAIDSAHASDASGLQPLSSVKVKGYFTGYEKDETGLLGSDVKLNRCVVVRNEK